VYFLAALSTFLSGLASFFEKSLDETAGMSSPALKIDPFTAILPIISFIFDFDVRRVYRRKEKFGFLIGKALLWAFFYLILGLSATDGASIPTILARKDLLKFANFMFLIWPCIGVGYSYCLTKFSMFSLPLLDDNGANIQGPED
jgi:hypothetical protein